jgi:hypothetical protein
MDTGMDSGMDIAVFFQQSEGKWSSIKSNHHVATTQQQSGRSTIFMTQIPLDEGAIAALKITWDGTMEGNPQEKGESTLVAIGAPNQGELRRSVAGVVSAGGEYSFGEGGELILRINDGANRLTERIWFESDNVRMRHTKVEQADGTNVVTFCSDVRLLGAK